MEKLNNEDVMHVANLAKLNISDDELNMYSEQLTGIMNEIEKITTLELMQETKVLITPTENFNVFSSDMKVEMLSKEKILKNASFKDENYIKVVKVLND